MSGKSAKTENMKRALLAGAAMWAGLYAPAAFAQGDEIVVTARKRAETLQDVPLAVTAISGIDIENKGYDNITDLYAEVPGLYFAKGSITNPVASSTFIVMRGVGWNAGLEPGVGVFIDGMYQPQIGYDMAFLDLERVEVLRGPQGTLFGRNTQGGAINLVSRKPDDEFRGNMRAEFAEFDTLKASGAFSGPIGENFYAGLAAEYSRTDGYIYNVVREEDQIPSERISGRAVLRWTPTPELDVTLTGDASVRNFNEMMRGVPLPERDYHAYGDEDADDKAKNAGAQLNIEYDFGNGVTVTSISGYRNSVSDVFGDTDSRITDQTSNLVPPMPPITTEEYLNKGATTPFRNEHEYASQELRLAGTSDSLDWLIGGYYFDQATDLDSYRFLGGPVAPFPFPIFIAQFTDEKRDGWAVFGQASYRPTERLELTFGGRFSDETYEVSYERAEFRTSAFPLVFKNDSSSDDNFSYMGSIAFDLTDNANVYATYAKGWKAGGIDVGPSNRPFMIPYADESSTNYEIGYKTSWFDGRLTMNGAFYWIDIKDQQVAVFTQPPGETIPIRAVQNAVTSRVRGVEFEMSADVTESFNVSGALAYGDTEYGEYTRESSTGPDFELKGLDFENIPEITANVAGTYRTQISDGIGLEAYLSWRYVGNVVIQDNYIGAPVDGQMFIPSYDRLDGRISLYTNEGWRVTAFVDNILDSFDYTDATSDPYFPSIYPVYVKPLEPRQFGVSISKRF